MVPIKRIEYFGNIVDIESMNISLPARRVDEIVKGCKELMCKSEDKIREVGRVIGLLMAAIPAVEMGKLHYRKLEAAKIASLHKVKGDFDIYYHY